MREIELSQGLFAQVDDEDYEYLNQWKWCAARANRVVYAIRMSRDSNNKRIRIWMHRNIINPPQGLVIDHIDHNGLNNQKSNLRVCTVSQNLTNQRPHSKTGLKGVRILKGFIIAGLRYKDKYVHLGTFKTLEEAGRAVDEATKKYYGEYAYTNY